MPLTERRRDLLLLLALCALCFFSRLGGNGLFDLDEGLYAVAAREMRLSGDIVTPRINGATFFEKPPLVYWTAAASILLFGPNEFAARLPNALATTLLVFLIYLFGAQCFGRRAGLLAAAFFALSPLVLGAARQLTMDALLDLWVATALFCFFQGYTAKTPRGKRCYYGFWAACGLGVLTKGAPGIVLPAATALLFLLFAERFDRRSILRAVGETRPFLGLLLFLLIAIPWHVAAWQANGEVFWQEYIVRQHLGRFRGGDTSHRAPFWFFIPGFLLGAFPWSVFVPAALAEKNLTIEDTEDSEKTAALARLFLKVWAVFVFLLFSASGSKLVSYILPMYAAAALLAGDRCARAIEAKEGDRALLVGGGVAFGLAALLYGVLLFHTPLIRLIEAQTHRPVRLDQVPPGMLTWAVHLAGITALATGAFLLLALLHRKRAAFLALTGGMALFVANAVFEGLPTIDAAFCAPLQSLAAQAGREAAWGMPLAFCVGPPRRPSVLFYLPDELLTRRRAAPYVLETTSLVDVQDRLPRYPLVLTDTARAEILLREPGTRLLERRGNWALMGLAQDGGNRR